MVENRIWHGAFWGMWATMVAGTVPLWAMAFSAWPPPEPITAAVFGRLLGIETTSAAALAIAILWQAIYGGLWGAFLGFVSGPLDYRVPARPSPVWIGLGVGLYRWVVVNLTVVIMLGWGPFGFLVTPRIGLATLVSDLLFGGVAGWLLHLEDRGAISLPFARLRHRVTHRRLAA